MPLETPLETPPGSSDMTTPAVLCASRTVSCFVTTGRMTADRMLSRGGNRSDDAVDFGRIVCTARSFHRPASPQRAILARGIRSSLGSHCDGTDVSPGFFDAHSLRFPLSFRNVHPGRDEKVKIRGRSTIGVNGFQ